MRKTMQWVPVLAAAVIVTSALCFAENSGEAVYKAKCFKCHGETGMAETSMGKALKVKPATDPTVKKMSLKEMIEATRNGMGKMQPYKDTLTEGEIKSSTEYFRAFVK